MSLDPNMLLVEFYILEEMDHMEEFNTMSVKYERTKRWVQ